MTWPFQQPLLFGGTAGNRERIPLRDMHRISLCKLSLSFRRSPISIAAAAIYMASQASGDKKTQKGESYAHVAIALLMSAARFDSSLFDTKGLGCGNWLRAHEKKKKTEKKNQVRPQKKEKNFWIGDAK